MFNKNKSISFPISNNKKISPKKPKIAINEEIDFKIKKEIHKVEQKLKKQVEKLQNELSIEKSKNIYDLNRSDNLNLSNLKTELPVFKPNIVLQNVTQHVVNTRNNNLSSYWKSGNNENNIYYDVGPVSIGTENPILLNNESQGIKDFSLDSFPEKASGLFGYAIDFDYGGTLAVIGAPLDTQNSGKVYVYQYANSTWESVYSFDAPDPPQSNDKQGYYFGNSISCNNGFLAVGAPGISAVFTYQWERFQDKAYGLVNSYTNIGGKNSSGDLNYKIGTSVSIASNPNQIIDYSLIAGDYVNDIVYYWRNKDDQPIAYPDNNEETGISNSWLGYSVKTCWSNNFTGKPMPIFMIGSPHYNDQSNSNNIECGLNTILIYNDSENQNTYTQIDMNSSYINSGNHFGWDLAIADNADFFMVSSPDASNSDLNIYGIVETFKLQNNNSEQNPIEVWKYAVDLSLGAYNNSEPENFMNFGYSMDIDQNNKFLAISSPDVLQGTDVSAECWVYQITDPLAPVTKRSLGTYDEGYEPFPGGDSLQFAEPIHISNLQQNDDFNASFGEAIAIQSNKNNSNNVYNFSLLVSSPDSFPEPEGGGQVWNFNNYPVYYNFNVKGNTLIDGDLTVTSDLSINSISVKDIVASDLSATTISVNDITINGKDIQQISVPTGSIMTFAGNSNNIDGYLLCDGTSYNNQDYPQLYNVIETNYGDGDSEPANGVFYFNVPDLTGKFIYGKTSSENVGQEKGSESFTLKQENIPELSDNFMLNNQTTTDETSGVTSFRTPMVYDYSGCWTTDPKYAEPEAGAGYSRENPAYFKNPITYIPEDSNGEPETIENPFGYLFGQFYGTDENVPDQTAQIINATTGLRYMVPQLNVGGVQVNFGESDPESIETIPPSVLMAYFIKT
jgi:microcystin-dependent protein